MKTVNDFIKSRATDIMPLLSLTLNKSYAQLMTDADYVLNLAQKKRLNRLNTQRKKGIPFAYLAGTKGFYHLDFKVTPDTLIPRPETELLIDIVLGLFTQKQAVKLLDLGTGSGIIAIILADKNPHWRVVASDFSKKALKVARQNTTLKIDFKQGDWFAAVPNQQFDCIVTNPPYIEANDPCLQALTFEPKAALTAGIDGLDAIRHIIRYAPKYLTKNGYLLLEHGHNQQNRVKKLLSADFHNIQLFNDYNSKNRCVLAQRKP